MALPPDERCDRANVNEAVRDGLGRASSADTRACQADKSQEQIQMMTSAIGRAATKATAIVEVNALSKFTS
jgi:hypothetical protein